MPARAESIGSQGRKTSASRNGGLQVQGVLGKRARACQPPPSAVSHLPPTRARLFPYTIPVRRFRLQERSGSHRHRSRSDSIVAVPSSTFSRACLHFGRACSLSQHQNNSAFRLRVTTSNQSSTRPPPPTFTLTSIARSLSPSEQLRQALHGVRVSAVGRCPLRGNSWLRRVVRTTSALLSRAFLARILPTVFYSVPIFKRRALSLSIERWPHDPATLHAVSGASVNTTR